MLFAPSIDQVLLEVPSTSDVVRPPVTVEVPATAVPSRKEPASVTAPALAVIALVTTGVSFVPLMVTVISWSTVAPNSSVARTVKVSLTWALVLSACVVERLLSRTYVQTPVVAFTVKAPYVVLFGPLTDQVFVAEASTSEVAKVPETVEVPATASPASVTAPTVSMPRLATVGASFEPLIVTTTVCSAVAPWSSVTRTT